MSAGRWLVLLTSGLFILGTVIFSYGLSFPVYTDPGAPDRLSLQLEHITPSKDRFDAWFSQLHRYEMPHKKLSDLGSGLASAGLGLFLAGALWRLYPRLAAKWRLSGVFIVWIGLWLARIPFSIHYYFLREERFDYPTWGDSIAIPIAEESVIWSFEAIASSILLGVLLVRHPLASRIELSRPFTTWGWLRAGLIGLWLLFLAFDLGTAIPDGDEGAIFSVMGAAVILLAFLSSDSQPTESAPRT